MSLPDTTFPALQAARPHSFLAPEPLAAGCAPPAASWSGEDFGCRAEDSPRTRAVRPAVVTTDQKNRVRGSAAALALLDDARLFPLLPNLARVLQYQRRRSQFCLPCGRVRNEDPL